jgi:CBS domain-containing protein
MATLRDILAVKGSHVYTVAPWNTVQDAICLMNERQVGALVVTSGERVAGMFTERDVLRRVVGYERPPSQTAVSEVMTGSVLVGDLDTPVEEASRIMKDRRIRHLPVLGPSGELHGLVSIGDVNAYHSSLQEATIQHLQEYVYGRT